MKRLGEILNVRGRLARRLIVGVVLFSSLITLLTTAIQLYLDYRHDLGQIERDFDVIEASYLRSLINSVWVADEAQIRVQLDGLRRLPDMEYLSIAIEETPRWTAGSLESTRVVSRSYPLIYRYRGNDVEIGTLQAVASLDAVYARLIDKVLIILVSNGVKTFLVAGFILAFFHLLVTRHLWQISAFVREQPGTTTPTPVRLARRADPARHDELDDVVDAVNEMQRRTFSTLASLGDSEARLRAILNAAVDAIITIDETGRIEDLNPAVGRMFGYSGSDLRGENVKVLMPEPDRGHHDRYLRAYLRTGEKKIIGIGREVTGQRKDGSTFPMHLSVSEFNLDGRRLFTGIVHDLTERKQAEVQLRHSQRMDAIGQLTGGVAHDFNNLLTVITGNLEMLEPKITDEKQRIMVEQAQEAADLGADLTARLLAFARRQSLEPRTIDVNDLVLGMSELLRRTLGESIQIGTVLGNKLWPTRADPGQLENALLNLAINARDAMPQGGSLNIETANLELGTDGATAPPGIDAGDYVVLSVTDTGVGMDKETKDRAIDPFFTTKEAGAGTGLGLSMVYGFARQSDGHLAIESEVGAGTSVSLFLPRDQEAAEAAESVETPAEETHAAGETVLVVEDDPRVRRTSVMRLEELNYAVLEADSGQAALEILSDGHRVDLLFTDIVMPGGMNGRELAARARSIDPGLRILFTSGYAEDVAGELLEEGAILIRKPYKMTELASRIREALGAQAADGG